MEPIFKFLVSNLDKCEAVKRYNIFYQELYLCLSFCCKSGNSFFDFFFLDKLVKKLLKIKNVMCRNYCLQIFVSVLCKNNN